MPLYLRKPRKGKSPNFEIRGTYLGVRVERSAGTSQRSVANRELAKLKTAIEDGKWPPAAPVARTGEPTFLSAAIAYMQQGGQRQHVGALIRRFGETPLVEMTQELVDQAAVEMRPNVTSATRNRAIYTPVSAILHHALGDKAPRLRRPKGAKGKVRTDFLSETDARAILAAADPELGVLLTFLIYTGCRLGEALALTWDDVDLDKSLAYIKHTKNGDPRTVLLRTDLREMLTSSRGGVVAERTTLPHNTGGTASKAGSCAPALGKLFPFAQGGHLKWMLRRATLKVCGIDAPKRRPNGYKTPPHRLRWVNFHSMRHTFASWFRRAGGDVQGLVATGNWRDPRSAARYAHVVARDEWQRVENLPALAGNGRGKTDVA